MVSEIFAKKNKELDIYAKTKIPTPAETSVGIKFKYDKFYYVSGT